MAPPTSAAWSDSIEATRISAPSPFPPSGALSGNDGVEREKTPKFQHRLGTSSGRFRRGPEKGARMLLTGPDPLPRRGPRLAGACARGIAPLIACLAAAFAILL